MFQLFFKYPITVFTKGKFILLGTWPGWLLLFLILIGTAGLGLLIRARLPAASPQLKMWRAGVIWGLQATLLTIVLLLLWQPAMTIQELKSQQNMIAVLVDDSRSMSVTDSGGDGRTTRESAALRDLSGGVLAGLQNKFQVRLYRLDSQLERVAKPEDVHPTGAATHIGDALKKLAAETSDLPLGAVVLLSDGAENAGGLDNEAIAAMGNRKIPVHTVGFGQDHAEHDLELSDVVLASRAMAQSRMTATVSFSQYGYSGAKTVLAVKDGGNVLASREVMLSKDGAVQSEKVSFAAGAAGVKNLTFSLGLEPNEDNVANNQVSRLVNVSGDKRRILYVEGEPRWEYKFIRRSAEDDPEVQVVSMLRTTENKIYRQGISDPKELADGFPTRAEDLFGYQAIILGSVEAGYFTPTQQELIREFVDRRGGGLLFLGGRFALSEGGWPASSLADLVPTFLPNGKGTFHRDAATVQLTRAGTASDITRLVDDPAANEERWKKLPYLADYQDAGSPKPGTIVLAEMHAGRGTTPLLATQSYGRGRTALMATSGTWRWQMSSPLGDLSHDHFWQQLLRWLSADSPDPVTATMASQTLLDDGHAQLTAVVRDKDYLPAPDAHVTARISGPNGVSTMMDMEPVPNTPGTFQAEWSVDKAGPYLAEVTGERGKEELGRNAIAFARTDGVAENFQIGQNRALLEKLSADTGGRYWKQEDLGKLPSEISYSEAGISVRDTKELWNMPINFLILLGIMSAEWLLRRKWGVV